MRGDSALVASSRIHSSQSRTPPSSIETTTTAAVTTTTWPSARHSRRTANQRRPTPGVTLVSSIAAQVPGYRNPSRMATARSTATGGVTLLIVTSIM